MTLFCGGCCWENLKPTDVMRLDVVHVQMAEGKEFVQIRGVAFHSSVGPTRCISAVDKDEMRIKIPLGSYRSPHFFYKIEIPHGVNKIIWDDVCVWERKIALER